MNERDRRLALEIKKRLSLRLRQHLKKLIIFGSRARGEATDESDLDLVALVDEKTPEIERALEDIVYQVMWDHDFKPVISLKVFNESQFNEAVRKGFSFYGNVHKEGVAV